MSEDNTKKDESIEAVEDPTAKLQAENAELRNQLLYFRADFDNYRKQAIKERSDLVKFGAEPVLREFLGVLDDLERSTALEVTADNIDSFKNGLALIVNQFKKTLERFGVEEIPSKGQAFDPQVHEALGSLENPDLPPNAVAEVFKKAYKLHGKVIRPAQVMVNSSSQKGE